MSDQVQFPIPLLSPTESTTIELSPRFTFLCMSTEFFVVSYADTVGMDHRHPNVIQGQVGIRCIYCAKREDTKYEDKLRSLAFPRSIEDTAYCVQFLGLMHIMTCPSAPFASTFNDQPEKSHLEQLSAYCVLKCEKLNIVSRAPHMSGLFLRQLPIMKPKPTCFNSLEDFASHDKMENKSKPAKSPFCRVEKYEPGSNYEHSVHYGPFHPGCGYQPYPYYGRPSYCTIPFSHRMQNDLNRQSATAAFGYDMRSNKPSQSTANFHPQKKRPLEKSFNHDMRSQAKKGRIDAKETRMESSNPKSNTDIGRNIIPDEIIIDSSSHQSDRPPSVDTESSFSSRQIASRRVGECSAIELLNLAMDMMERSEGYTRPGRTHASSSQKESDMFQKLDSTAPQSVSSVMTSRDGSRDSGVNDVASKACQNLSHEHSRSINRASNDNINREPSDASKSNTRNALMIMKSPSDNDFPYFKDVFGSWVCRFCCYIPFSDRAYGSIWQGNAPPDDRFMKSHLQLCNDYSQYQLSTTSNTIINKSLNENEVSGNSADKCMRTIDDVPKQIESVQATNHDSQPNSRITLREKQAQHKKSMFSKTRKTEAIVLALKHLDDYESEANKDTTLISNDDRPLISDFIFHIIKQLRICSLDENDQKGRGKTRATFEIGFMGVQCNHCKAKPRKFFWTDVSRFNNSFSSEIISHVMSCCPTDIQRHLLELKKIHSVQMGYLPRGSQKLFFDKLWERIHSHPKPDRISQVEDTVNLYLAEDSVDEIKRLSEDSLMLNHESLLDKENCFSFGSTTAVKGVFLLLSLKRILDPPILLAVDEDFLFLPQYDCFIRSNLEVFCAENTFSDTSSSLGKWSLVEKGNVGIRCVHCVGCGDSHDEHAVSFPQSLNTIRQCAHSIATNHLGRCPCLPRVTKNAFLRMQGNNINVSSDLATKYYASAGSALGIVSAPSGFGLVLSKSENV